MVISQKVGVWTWFWYQIKAESLYSLQWYQKLILPKMSLVPCFVGVNYLFVHMCTTLAYLSFVFKLAFEKS